MGQQEQMNHTSQVLIISHDVISACMAGPGIRYWKLAHVLAHYFPVTLATPGTSDIDSTEVTLCSYRPGEWASLSPAVAQARAILLCGDVLTWFPMLESTGIPLIVDGYDPHPLETLAMFAGAAEQEKRYQDRERILQLQCQVGDFFICASERQRDWWLGLLEAAGRVNVHTYNDDPSLRKLIDVVPFGLPSKPALHTKQVLKGVWPGIGPDDEVVLWGGGLWQWLDPLTAIQATAFIQKQRPSIRLVFPGTRHPNPDVMDMPMLQAAIQLARELNLMGRAVFFGDWVPYKEWANYLLEADVALSLHFDTLETRMAYRSRVLDYVWAGLPMVVTGGDVTSEIAVADGLGLVVDYEDVEGVAAAISDVLDRPKAAFSTGFAKVREALTWEKAAHPLVTFCRDPHQAPDKVVLGDHYYGKQLQTLRAENARLMQQKAGLETLVRGYEQGKFIRLMKWLHAQLGRG